MHNVAIEEERTMTSVGVRDLKGQLSRYLRRVKAGERLAITERGKLIAVLSPPAESAAEQQLETMLREGIASWDGGKPAGASRPVKLRGPSVADAVIEERR
jgi:prevent-host-death family protein